MGCDIHAFVEIKINNAWYLFNQPCIDRCYPLFTKIAGVRRRNDDIVQITPVRGLPDDVAFATKFCSEYQGSDGHNHTWLTSAEAGEVQEWYLQRFRKDQLFGWLFGNNIDSYVRYPRDGHKLHSLGFQDARVVIWFDN